LTTKINSLAYWATHTAISTYSGIMGASLIYYMFGSGGERSEPGKGGTDVTWVLASLQRDVSDKWSSLTNEQKQLTINSLYNLNPFADSFIIRSWDIDDFFKHKKGQFAGPKSAGYCPNTVTISGKVYYAEDVNYFLWGLINRLAYDDGYRIIDTSRFTSTYMVYLYRTTLFPHTIGSGANMGRLAWSVAGWDAGKDAPIVYPDYIANSVATPNMSPHTKTISWRVGDEGKAGIGRVLYYNQ
jgi:hypothetical protein